MIRMGTFIWMERERRREKRKVTICLKIVSSNSHITVKASYDLLFKKTGNYQRPFCQIIVNFLENRHEADGWSQLILILFQVYIGFANCRLMSNKKYFNKMPKNVFYNSLITKCKGSFWKCFFFFKSVLFMFFLTICLFVCLFLAHSLTSLACTAVCVRVPASGTVNINLL